MKKGKDGDRGQQEEWVAISAISVAPKKTI